MNNPTKAAHNRKRAVISIIALMVSLTTAITPGVVMSAEHMLGAGMTLAVCLTAIPFGVLSLVFLIASIGYSLAWVDEI